MSIKAGQYLGGIRDLEGLRCRCRINDETGCWVWGMGTGNGKPSINLRIDGVHKRYSGRRAAAVLSIGKDPGPGVFVWARDDCKESLCVNPAHIKTGSEKQCKADLAKRGLFKGLAGTIANGHREASKRLAKISREQAAEIRTMKAPIADIASRYGICVSNVYLIRSGKTWRDIAIPNSSVFARRA